MSRRAYGDTPWWEHVMVTLAAAAVPAAIVLMAVFGGKR